jgi:hypothetical protein
VPSFERVASFSTVRDPTYGSLTTDSHAFLTHTYPTFPNFLLSQVSSRSYVLLTENRLTRVTNWVPTNSQSGIRINCTENQQIWRNMIKWSPKGNLRELNDPGLDSRRRQDIFLFSETSKPALGLSQLPTEWVPGIFSGSKSVGGWSSPIKFIQCWVKMRAAIPQLPLYACTMWTGTLPLPITFITSVFKMEFEGNHKCIICNTYRQNSMAPPIREIRVHTQVGLTLKMDRMWFGYASVDWI